MRGGKREGAGRPKGVPNKVTAQAREAFNGMFDHLAGEVETWIRKTAETDPGGAVDLLLRVAAFFVPKPQRQTIGPTRIPNEEIAKVLPAEPIVKKGQPKSKETTARAQRAKPVPPAPWPSARPQAPVPMSQRPAFDFKGAIEVRPGIWQLRNGQCVRTNATSLPIGSASTDSEEDASRKESAAQVRLGGPGGRPRPASA